MPMSIDPPPKDNEFECARCGARVYYELTRCPNCGVNLYEPEDELKEGNRQTTEASRPAPAGFLTKLGATLRRLSGKPYRADEVFGDGLNQAVLYNDLLRKVGGDQAAAERLIDYERQRAPQATRSIWLQQAIQRWERDNKIDLV